MIFELRNWVWLKFLPCKQHSVVSTKLVQLETKSQSTVVSLQVAMVGTLTTCNYLQQLRNIPPFMCHNLKLLEEPCHNNPTFPTHYKDLMLKQSENH